MNPTLTRALDPLDLEIIEEALAVVLDNTFTNKPPVDLAGGKGLEAALRRELVEMALSSNVSDPDALRDVLVTHLFAKAQFDRSLRTGI